MNKQKVMQAVRDQLSQQLKRLKAANRGATESATDNESRAETKWDTSGLEASYLARGYAKQFEKTATELETLRNLDLKDPPATRVRMGSLIQTETADFTDWLFLLPCCGGMEVVIDGIAVTVVTPASPLATQLMHKGRGSDFQGSNGINGRIVSVA